MPGYNQIDASPKERSVITALHSKRNRFYLRTLVFLMLASWIAMILSATCTMPSILVGSSSPMPGCPESGASGQPHHYEENSKAMEDCTFKSCLDTQSDSFSDFNRLVKPDLPLIILFLVWAFWRLFFTPSSSRVLPKTGPPFGRRILLIYRFCTLLN